MSDDLFVGLMSGTSVDAVDAALLRCRPEAIELLATREQPIPETIREQVQRLSHTGPDEIERLGRLDRQMGRLFAEAASTLLNEANLDGLKVRAIGSHGQTVRHRPPSGGGGDDSFTLQIGDPNTIAECTGITTVADFRRRDIACGGEGAPLAPAFHAGVFADKSCNRAIVNIGGIANISLLRGEELVSGFDCGPGNTLLDLWAQRHLARPCDRGGEWAAGGTVIQPLLDAMLAHPYLSLSGPRSTGKEAFNLAWLDSVIKHFPDSDIRDIQATLAQFTCDSIAGAIESSPVNISGVYVCGGGAHNADLMARLGARLSGRSLQSTTALGIDPDWVEAATFAWLAYRTLAGLAGNARAVTGAAGDRVLGGIYPGT